MIDVAATYTIRFFFDAGSGTCFWSGNDASRDRFGYFIDPGDLPLAPATFQGVIKLIKAYDSSFDWDNPGESNAADVALQHLVDDSAVEVIRNVRRDLGPEYDVVDERHV